MDKVSAFMFTSGVESASGSFFAEALVFREVDGEGFEDLGVFGLDGDGISTREGGEGL